MISFGIPAYNEEKSIQTSIKSILPQLNKHDEIIVVASGCEDRTAERVLELNDPRIKLISEENRGGKAQAINIILYQAKNKIVVLLDADVIVDNQAINTLVRPLRKKKVGCVSGKICGFKHKTFFDRLQNFGWKALNDQKIEENSDGSFYALNGYLVAIKKGIISPLDKVNLAEDALMGWMVKRAGYKVIYEPNARVFVKAAQNFSDYINQKVRVRVGWWQMRDQGMRISERRNFGQLKYLFRNIYAWPYIAIDFFIWGLAYWRYKTKRFEWKKVHSSKI